jgi:hypothetical protein
VISHGANAGTRTPASLIKWTVGALNNNGTPEAFLDGLVGEFWTTNTDISADAGQLPDWLVQQLAYGGPFSVPHIAKDIVDYRSFRSGLASDQDRVGEGYPGRFGRRTWSNVNGVTLGAHPPLPANYARPPGFTPLRSFESEIVAAAAFRADRMLLAF